MSFLGNSDITDKVLAGLVTSDTDPIFDRADKALETLAQSLGVRDVTVIGTPAGATEGAVLVKGASQTGDTLITDGYSNSGTIIQGTRFRVNDLRQTYQLKSDATVGGGTTTLALTRTLEAAPADNASVRFQRLHEAVFEWHTHAHT